MISIGGVARPAGAEPAVEIILPQTEFIYGMRLHYAYISPTGAPGLFESSWQLDRSDRGPRELGTRVVLEAGPDELNQKTATIWVNASIDRFRMVPKSKMFALRLAAVELLLPKEPTLTRALFTGEEGP
jgi:hypothetical protein